MARDIHILFIGDGFAVFEAAFAGHFKTARPNWTTRFAKTAGDTREALRDLDWDAVVLDLAPSPAGERLGLLKDIRHHFPRTPVVLVLKPDDARLLRDSFAGEVESDHFALPELDPALILFKDTSWEKGAAEAIEGAVAEGLYRFGRISNPQGVLITHGTDTMAWGFAYLRYALRDLTANVAMTGSQLPLGGYFTESDALGNLRTAAFLLNCLRPARLFAVFNNGRSVFSGRLTKFRKWDSDAFEGRMIASATSGSVLPLRKDWVYIPYADQRLDRLHLVRTGGTIESKREGHDAGGLKPTGDFVSKYLSDSLGDHFAQLVRHDLFALDSSNMSCEDWAQIAKAIEQIGVARADTQFDPTIKPVFCNPLFTTEDYRAQFAACGAGAVLAGFGGGNANVRSGSSHSILPALQAAVRAGTFVAVTSQVPLEPYDAEYETGLALLEAGGVPCGDLPLADAQIKLAYLLGHRDLIEAKAAEKGIGAHHLTAAAFLSGVSMRRAGSHVTILNGAGRTVPLHTLPYDPFATEPFDRALDAVTGAL